jgi:hypothetical protein
MARIIQIACSQSQDVDSGVSSSLYALTDEGEVLELHDQEMASDENTGVTVGLFTGFWRPLPNLDVKLPVFVSTVAGKTECDVRPHHYVQRLDNAAKAKAAAKAGRQAALQADVF